MLVIRLGIIILSLLALSACSSNNGFSDLDRFMAAARAKPRGHVDPLPTFKAYKAFTYSASNRRSPFSPPATVEQLTKKKEVAASSNVKPDFDRPKELLESFSISSLKMVGTLKKDGSGTLWALIEDNQGGIHRVKVGQHMGKNFGKIVAINNSQIDLIEIVPNGHGGWLERPRSLTLADN
jgi:type IV pilus assembly protein PilP